MGLENTNGSTQAVPLSELALSCGEQFTHESVTLENTREDMIPSMNFTVAEHSG